MLRYFINIWTHNNVKKYGAEKYISFQNIICPINALIPKLYPLLLLMNKNFSHGLTVFVLKLLNPEFKEQVMITSENKGDYIIFKRRCL